MTDKVQKIKEWISKEQDGLMDAQGNFEYPEHEGAYHILCSLDTYIDSMQEEPVSNDLEEAARKAGQEYFPDEYNIWARPNYEAKKAEYAFMEGAQWQKKHLEENRIKHCDNITEEQYNLESDFVDDFIDKHDRMPTFLDAIEYGINYKKE